MLPGGRQTLWVFEHFGNLFSPKWLGGTNGAGSALICPTRSGSRHNVEESKVNQYECEHVGQIYEVPCLGNTAQTSESIKVKYSVAFLQKRICLALALLVFSGPCEPKNLA